MEAIPRTFIDTMKLLKTSKLSAIRGACPLLTALAGIFILACSSELNSGSQEPGASKASSGGGQNLMQGDDGSETSNGGSGAGSSSGTDAEQDPPSATSGTTSPGAASACKRGVPFDRWVEPLPSRADLAALSPQAAWFYNWTPYPHPSLDYQAENFDFIPMIKSGDFDADELIASLPSDATALLGFNEPMIHEAQGGVDMSLDEVLARWPDVERVANARDLTLVSPAVTFANNGGMNGPDFMRAFFERCPDCRVDAIAMHTYTCEVQWVRDHIEPYREFGLPIWVTEFACFDEDAARVERFMRETVEFFESDPDIARYAWFMGRANGVGLLNASGALTSLGELYVSLPYDEACTR